MLKEEGRAQSRSNPGMNLGWLEAREKASVAGCSGVIPGEEAGEEVGESRRSSSC